MVNFTEMPVVHHRPSWFASCRWYSMFHGSVLVFAFTMVKRVWRLGSDFLVDGSPRKSQTLRPAMPLVGATNGNALLIRLYIFSLLRTLSRISRRILSNRTYSAGALRIPEVGAVCSNSVRTDLCGRPRKGGIYRNLINKTAGRVSIRSPSQGQ